ncbi:MAG: hypothetical protein VX833_01300 [Actinomycetota bacterium]|nr:hypothetical protein [Actinomycetota bacterium]
MNLRRFDQMVARLPVWQQAAAVVGLVAIGGIVAAATLLIVADPGPLVPRVLATPISAVAPQFVAEPPTERSVRSYHGLGTWVDSFDADPSYARRTPTVDAGDVAEMASHGVNTLFLQAARSDDRSGLATSDPWVLADFLLHGHRHGIDVVAWYLPMWTSDGEDLERLLALHNFEVLGDRFDGLAVDIEWNRGGLRPAERTARLVDLAANLREAIGAEPLGAIVMPPLLTDEINPDFWPGFPWATLADHFDVWLPMSYWSFRTEEHADPRYYSAESIRLLRRNLGNPNAPVHGIGGIGAADGTAVPDPGEPMATIDDLEGFVASLTDTDAVGGSIYDWATTGSDARRRLSTLFAGVSSD